MSERHPTTWTLEEELAHMDAEHGWSDDEREPEVTCPICLRLLPLAGENGWVRHMLAVHPENKITRAIFARLVEVQLVNAEEVAR